MLVVMMVGLAGDQQPTQCEGPGFPLEPDIGFLEMEVIAGFRVWQLAFMSAFAMLGLVILLCCIFRCRIPRTKQEIEADSARKRVTKQFSQHLRKIPVDKMELEKVLPEVITLEHHRVLKGIKEEKLTFFQKLKKKLKGDEDEDEEEEGDMEDLDTKTGGLSTSEAKTPDEGQIVDLEEVVATEVPPSSRISHQEQLKAAIHKLNRMRQVQQQLQSLSKVKEEAKKLATEASIVQREHSKEKTDPESRKGTPSKSLKSSPEKRSDHSQSDKKKTHSSQATFQKEPSKESSGGSKGSHHLLPKQKTCPTQFETDVVRRDVSLSTFKKAISEDVEAVKQVREKREKRMSRQITLTEKDVDVIRRTTPKEEVVYEEIRPVSRDRDRSRHHHPERDRETRSHSRGHSRHRSRDHHDEEDRRERRRRQESEGYENGKEDNVTSGDEERTKF